MGRVLCCGAVDTAFCQPADDCRSSGVHEPVAASDAMSSGLRVTQNEPTNEAPSGGLDVLSSGSTRGARRATASPRRRSSCRSQSRKTTSCVLCPRAAIRNCPPALCIERFRVESRALSKRRAAFLPTAPPSPAAWARHFPPGLAGQPLISVRAPRVAHSFSASSELLRIRVCGRVATTIPSPAANAGIERPFP